MNVPTAESFPLSLSCAHTHGHLYTIRIGRTILLIHTHTDVAFACLWHKVFCRLSEESSLLLPPAGNTSLFIDQGLAGWRERTERARDEEKWEKGENAAIMKQVLHRALVCDGECDGERQRFIIYLHSTGHSLLSSQILTCFELH